MDSIREPLLVVCMIIVVGGMFTMVSLIATLVIRGALKPQPHTSEKPGAQALAVSRPTPAPRKFPTPQPVSTS